MERLRAARRLLCHRSPHFRLLHPSSRSSTPGYKSHLSAHSCVDRLEGNAPECGRLFAGHFTSFTKVSRGGNLTMQWRGFGSVVATRNPLYSTVNDDDIRYFIDILGDKNVIRDEERLQTANIDWMGKYQGSSKLMLLPRSSKEVETLIFYDYVYL